MYYRHVTDTCFAEAIGPRGLEAAEFRAVLAETQGALDHIRKMHAESSLPLLRLPERRDDLDALAPVADRFRRSFDHVVVLGTGGSSLGGATLASLADFGFGPRPGAPKLHFLDNIDPDAFDELYRHVDLKRTGFIVISKSGSTAETLTQFLTAIPAMAASGIGEDALKHHVLCIAEPGDSVLRGLARRWNLECLDHDPLVGGRYSVLSLVGLLPAMIAGLDAQAVRQGARSVLDQALGAQAPESSAPAVGAAISVALLRQRGIHTTVLMPYIDRLANLGMWFRQLWAESLGKDGTGTTPIRAMGTVDQHSQLQLYLAGPGDKMFTVVTKEARGRGDRVAPALADDPRLGYLAGRTMGDLLDAEQRATAETLARQGRPTRLIHLSAVDEHSLGALMMHFMLETIIAAHLLKVDPFDQPAVEQGKILARQYLAEIKV